MVHGIPHGSILGHRIFIAYINDMCNVSSFMKYILFADDTTIFMSGYDNNLQTKKLVMNFLHSVNVLP